MVGWTIVMTGIMLTGVVVVFMMCQYSRPGPVSSEIH